MSNARITLLLALADDELMTGHRLGEWTGWVPYVEEDLALSSIAQDELAHAKALYEIACALGAAPDSDALAFGRAPEQYRNAVICERANVDFAFTLARHYLYDTSDDVRTESLLDSSFKDLAEVLRVFRLEERYHLEHAHTWFRRLADGPVDARHRFGDALTRVFPEAIALFEPLPDEAALVADGTMPAPDADLLARWLDRVAADLESVGLERVLESNAATSVGELVPTSSGAAEAAAPGAPSSVAAVERRDGRWVHAGAFSGTGAGGRSGHHSDEFAPMWEEMTALYRAHPGATW